MPGQLQVHRFPFGTLARTWSACAPQPVQVIFLQRLHVAGLHTGVLLRGGGMHLPVPRTQYTPWGILLANGAAAAASSTTQPRP